QSGWRGSRDRAEGGARGSVRSRQARACGSNRELRDAGHAWLCSLGLSTAIYVFSLYIQCIAAMQHLHDRGGKRSRKTAPVIFSLVYQWLDEKKYGRQLDRIAPSR